MSCCQNLESDSDQFIHSFSTQPHRSLPMGQEDGSFLVDLPKATVAFCCRHKQAGNTTCSLRSLSDFTIYSVPTNSLMSLLKFWTLSTRAPETQLSTSKRGRGRDSCRWTQMQLKKRLFFRAGPTAALSKTESQEAIFFRNAEKQPALPAKSHFYVFIFLSFQPLAPSLQIWMK